jgi:hypothetical protein
MSKSRWISNSRTANLRVLKETELRTVGGGHVDQPAQVALKDG